MDSAAKKARFKPQIVALLALLVAGVFALDVLFRKPELPDETPPPASPEARERQPGPRPHQPAKPNPTPTAKNKNVFRVRVVEVPDGDSLVVQLDGKRRRVRLQGVDCPERAQRFGPQAREFAQKLVKGQSVTLIKHGTDQYERVLANVTLGDGRDLAESLVEAGWAWQYRRYSRDADLERLQSQAKSARRGLWADANPTPPWQWRRDNPRQ